MYMPPPPSPPGTWLIHPLTFGVSFKTTIGLIPHGLGENRDILYPIPMSTPAKSLPIILTQPLLSFCYTYAFIPFNRVVIVLWQRIEISTYYFLLYFCFFTAYQVSRISLALVKLVSPGPLLRRYGGLLSLPLLLCSDEAYSPPQRGACGNLDRGTKMDTSIMLNKSIINGFYVQKYIRKLII